jgi:acyl carrier protein
MDAIENIIKEFIGNYADVAEVDDIHDNMSMADDLRFDSLNTLELAMDLEQEFSITTSNDEIYACKVVKDVIDLVKEKIDGIQGT